MASPYFYMSSPTVISAWTLYTPTYTGFGTVSATSMWWRRVGDTLQVRGNFTSGTATGVEARISLPTGLSSDATKVPAIQLAGVLIYNVAAAALTTLLIESNTSYLTFGLQQAGTAGLTKAVGTSITSLGNVHSIHFECPISGWSA